MLRTIFTLDYEIHGDGSGCPRTLMVDPTDRLLDLFDAYGARLTIMADVAEILRFRQFAEESGRDDFFFERIERQLIDAVRRGHDVQLHIHASYFGAEYRDERWQQDWAQYDFAALPLDRMTWMVGHCKRYLEALLQPVRPDYRCDVFRAANWSVSPSTNVVHALVANGIRIDTSVFKYGRRNGRVRFDYASAPSAALPWPAAARDICTRDETSPLWEFPIYAEERGLLAFATPQRVLRALEGRFHRLPAVPLEPGDATTRPPDDRRRRHAWKADFNQCTGHQLIAAIERAEARFSERGRAMPFVLIGHSKLFSRLNAWSLRPLLGYIERSPDRLQFGRFEDFPTPSVPYAATRNPPSRVLNRDERFALSSEAGR